MRTIAVIAATGEVGIKLIAVSHTSYRIVAIVRNREKRDFARYAGMAVRQVDDIADVDSLARALEGCEAIVTNVWLRSTFTTDETDTRKTVTSSGW